jgi:hypothetical protein
VWSGAGALRLPLVGIRQCPSFSRWPHRVSPRPNTSHFRENLIRRQGQAQGPRQLTPLRPLPLLLTPTLVIIVSCLPQKTSPERPRPQPHRSSGSRVRASQVTLRGDEGTRASFTIQRPFSSSLVSSHSRLSSLISSATILPVCPSRAFARARGSS